MNRPSMRACPVMLTVWLKLRANYVVGSAGGGNDASHTLRPASRPILSPLPPFQHVGAGLRQQTAGRIMPSIVVSLNASVDPITYDCGGGATCAPSVNSAGAVAM